MFSDEFFWNWILKDCMPVYKKMKIVVVCSWSAELSRKRGTTVKKCTKRGDTCAKICCLFLRQSCCHRCKRTQHCWPATPNIVGCYMLCPFAPTVTCCCVLLGVFVQSLKPVKRICKRTQPVGSTMLGLCFVYWHLAKDWSTKWRLIQYTALSTFQAAGSSWVK